MKQIYFSFLLISFIYFFKPGSISGQNEPGGLYLSGKITTEQGSVDGTIIKMTRNGVALKDYNVLPDGKFNLRFEFNNDYTLIFSRKDNFPQKIVISTQVPTDVLRRDRKFPPFPLDINLFTEVKGIERTFSENAVLKIYYSVSVDNFISDIFYNNQQIKKLIDQAILQSQNVKKESDFLKRLSAAELAEMKKDYNDLLTKAGKEFDSQQYIPALADYQDASRIFPEEQFPKDRIAEIKDLISVLGLQGELDAVLAKKAQTEAKAKAEAETKAKAEEDAKAKAKAEAEAKVKAEAEAERIKNAQAEAKVKADAEAERARITKEKEDAQLAAEAEKARLAAQIKARADSLKMAAEAERVKKAEAVAKAKAEEAAEKARIAAEEKARVEAQKNQLKAKYQLLINEADQLAADQKLVEAVGKFRTALEIQPQETYPIQRIEEIRGIITKQQADKKAFDAAVVMGDQAFGKKLYGQARTSYQQALQVKSGENYPAVMMAKIDSIETEIARLASVAKAMEDSLKQTTEAQAKAKAEALAKVKAEAEAEKLKKAEAEAKAKAEAEAERARIAKEKEDARLAAEAEKARQAALLKVRTDSIRMAAEAQAKAKAEALAKVKAEAEAEKLKKAEAEAKAKAEAETERLKKVEAEAKANAEARDREAAEAEKVRIAKEQNISKEIENLYNGLISIGDQAYAGKEYNVSRAWYYKALEIQPGKAYPLSRIEEINRIIHSRLLSETDIQFQQFIDKGDEAFRNNQLAVSRSWYNKALGIKSGDAYSKSQLSEIQIKIDENVRGNTDQSFKTYLEQGSKAFDQKQFGVAKVWYLRAQQLKPADDLVRQKLEAVQKVIDGQ
jgi:hypothetical protein